MNEMSIELPEIDLPEIDIPGLTGKNNNDVDGLSVTGIQQIKDLTDSAKTEIGESLKKIREYEGKFKERWEFEGDNRYYFSICFRSGKERDEFCKKHGITLIQDDHVFYDDIKQIFKGGD